MKWIFITTLCITLFGVHVMAAVMLAKIRQIAKNRFFRMAFYLIISDACLMIEYVWLTIIMNTNDLGIDGPHQDHCLVLGHLCPAAIQCSLLMTFCMCLHRLNATFTAPKRVLKMLTSNIAIGLGFVFIHVYVLLRCVLELLDELALLPCEPLYNTQKNFLLFIDGPNAIFVLLIACCYIVVIWRMRMNRHLVNETESLSKLQIQQRRKASLRMRYNLITLSCIIVVTACSILPRTLYGLYINVNDNINGEINRATNNLLLLNPLVDPFIYILRIKEIRCQFVCKCFHSNKITPPTQPATDATSASMSSNLKPPKTSSTTSRTNQLS
ncbi:PTGIR [Mytilus coruscus]|uniref:PTGIR n=1 Tax=Mytilus coruscus TaxID=42192 RepID=A0A6J8DYN3_MYTCO|nr:PTGIR [Mytilus coruscus]